MEDEDHLDRERTMDALDKVGHTAERETDQNINGDDRGWKDNSGCAENLIQKFTMRCKFTRWCVHEIMFDMRDEFFHNEKLRFHGFFNEQGDYDSGVKRWGILSCTPEPHIAFCPIFVHPLFPVFEPNIQKWVILVRRRPCVCDTFRFESLFLPPADYDNWPSRMSRTTRGKNKIPDFGKNTAWKGPTLGFQPPFPLNIAGCRPAIFSRKPAEGPKVGGLSVQGV